MGISTTPPDYTAAENDNYQAATYCVLRIRFVKVITCGAFGTTSIVGSIFFAL
jgi:hypothetical protein